MPKKKRELPIVPEEEGLPDDEKRVKAFKDRVFNLAMSGTNAAYARLYADMNGLIKIRSEETKKEGVSADDITKAFREAGLMEAKGMGKMPVGRGIFRKKVRDDSGRSEGSDTVPPVSAPDEAPGGLAEPPPGGDSES